MRSTKREKEIEARELKRARARGGDLWKFTSPGRRSVPDRIRFGGFVGVLNALHELREIVIRQRYSTHELSPAHVQKIIAHVIEFVEFKAPGKKPTSAQRRLINKLEHWGLSVEVIDK